MEKFFFVDAFLHIESKELPEEVSEELMNTLFLLNENGCYFEMQDESSEFTEITEQVKNSKINEFKNKYNYLLELLNENHLQYYVGFGAFNIKF